MKHMLNKYTREIRMAGFEDAGLFTEKRKPKYEDCINKLEYVWMVICIVACIVVVLGLISSK